MEGIISTRPEYKKFPKNHDYTGKDFNFCLHKKVGSVRSKRKLGF